MKKKYIYIIILVLILLSLVLLYIDKNNYLFNYVYYLSYTSEQQFSYFKISYHKNTIK